MRLNAEVELALAGAGNSSVRESEVDEELGGGLAVRARVKRTLKNVQQVADGSVGPLLRWSGYLSKNARCFGRLHRSFGKLE